MTTCIAHSVMIWVRSWPLLEHDSETMYTFVTSLRRAVPMADPPDADRNI
jgi:hypothetical protein